MSGTVYYCSAHFEPHIKGLPDGIEVASRTSAVDAREKCLVQAAKQRKKRAYIMLPKIKCLPNGKFAYELDVSSDTIEVVKLSVIFGSPEEFDAVMERYATLVWYQQRDWETAQRRQYHYSSLGVRLHNPDVPKKWYQFWK